MKYTLYILPVLILALFIYAHFFKKVKLYDSFVRGAKAALPLTVRIFPYLCAIFVLTVFFEISGAADFLSAALAPVLEVLGIPGELAKLMLLKPFSGSGSLALLSEIYAKHGADSYISRCASVIYSSSETVFYIAAVYYAKAEEKKILAPVLISLFSGLAAAVAGCFLCIIM